MNNFSPLKTPPSSPEMLTMADVISQISDDEQLSPTRKRDLISAIKRACHLLGRDPAGLPADIPILKTGLATLNPAQAGLARKTLQNIKANVLAALKHACGNQHGISKRRPLIPSWSTLMTGLPDKRYKSALSRLCRYCSDHNIAPDQVSDQVIAGFMTYVHTQTFARKPNDVHRRATRVWNDAVDLIPGWPQARLHVPDFRKPRMSSPIEAFPTSFQKDVESYLAWLSGLDLFTEHAPPNVCKPRTIVQRRMQITLMASALLRQGWQLNEIRLLEDLVTADAVKAILTDYLNRTNKKASTFVHGLAKTLIHDPEVLLLDKPAANLDPKARIDLRNLLRKLASEGKTILVSSHVLSELQDLCDAIGIMKDGTMIHSGTIDEIAEKTNPARTVQVYLTEAFDGIEDCLKDFSVISSVHSVDESRKCFEFIHEGTSQEEAEVLSSLVEKGAKIYRFEPKQSKVEDLFLQVESEDGKGEKE